MAVENLLCRQVSASRRLAIFFESMARQPKREKAARALPSHTGGLGSHNQAQAVIADLLRH